MYFYDVEQPSQSLRELAGWIIRDGIDSDHLDAYMNGLLSDRLLELPAICRVETQVVSHCFAGMAARDIAGRLCERACELERFGLPHGPSAAPNQQRSSSAIALNSGAGDWTAAGGRASNCETSWIPECIASIAALAVGMSLLVDWPRLLEFHPALSPHLDGLDYAAAGSYLLMALLYAGDVACRLRRRVRSRRRPRAG